MRRKWVLLSLTIILFLFMFYVAFRLLSIPAYVANSEDLTLSWLTEALRNLNFISGEAPYVANPVVVQYLLLLLVTVFVVYALFTLCLEAWMEKPQEDEDVQPQVFDASFYIMDNMILETELNKSKNLVLAIDDVSLFLNIDLLSICSKNHFILLCEGIVERFQHATDLVKSKEMRERYYEIIHLLTEDAQIRTRIIYYKPSEAVLKQYYLDQTYAADKFIASCLTATHEDQFKIKVISRNEAIIYKSKQLGFDTYQLTSMIEESKEVNVWETEESRGIVH